MIEKFITIKDISLNNNCPECYSKEGLQLTFKQKFVETKFYKSITPKINQEITCKTCNTIIYPERWTEDIERVFEYQKKTFTPKKPSTYFKKASWFLFFSALLIIVSSLLIALYASKL